MMIQHLPALFFSAMRCNASNRVCGSQSSLLQLNGIALRTISNKNVASLDCMWYAILHSIPGITRIWASFAVLPQFAFLPVTAILRFDLFRGHFPLFGRRILELTKLVDSWTYKNTKITKITCQQAAYLIFPSISFSLRFGECSELPGDASEGSKLLLWRFCGFTKKLQKSAIALLHGPISFQTGLHDKRMITFHPYGSVLAKEPSRAQWVLFIGTTELFLRAKMCFL